MPIGQHLGDGDGGEEGEQRGGPDLDAHADGLGREERGEHEHELVGEADGEHVGGGGRVAAQPLEAEVHGAGEPPPALAAVEAAAEAVRGDERRARRRAARASPWRAPGRPGWRCRGG